MGDALAPGGDEGRGKLRKAAGSCKRTLIRRCPNGTTPMVEDHRPRKRRQPGELKHLSNRRNRNQRDSLSSGERTGISPLSIVLSSRSSLESYTVESESLVNETKYYMN